jgi:hypothetical protein
MFVPFHRLVAHLLLTRTGLEPPPGTMTETPAEAPQSAESTGKAVFFLADKNFGSHQEPIANICAGLSRHRVRTAPRALRTNKSRGPYMECTLTTEPDFRILAKAVVPIVQICVSL